MNLTINHIPDNWEPYCEDAFFKWSLKIYNETKKIRNKVRPIKEINYE